MNNRYKDLEARFTKVETRVSNEISEEYNRKRQKRVATEKRADKTKIYSDIRRTNNKIEAKLQQFQSNLKVKDDCPNLFRWIGAVICLAGTIGTVVGLVQGESIPLLILPVGIVLVMGFCGYIDRYAFNDDVDKQSKTADTIIANIEKDLSELQGLENSLKEKD